MKKYGNNLVNMIEPFEAKMLSIFIMPPFEKGGAYCVAPVGRYVGRSVCR